MSCKLKCVVCCKIACFRVVLTVMFKGKCTLQRVTRYIRERVTRYMCGKVTCLEKFIKDSTRVINFAVGVSRFNYMYVKGLKRPIFK